MPTKRQLAIMRESAHENRYDTSSKKTKGTGKIIGQAVWDHQQNDLKTIPVSSQTKKQPR